MRDYRDAKTMAASLRKALLAHNLTIGHSESLELIAKAFGFDGWNVLAAKIDAAHKSRPAATRWQAGDVIVVRNVRFGAVSDAAASIVVEDRATRLILYTPLGSPMRSSAIDFRIGRQEPPRPTTRHTTDALVIYTPGAAHCVTAMYHGGGGPFICWYVDLMEPFRRVPGGIVINDLHLDIVIGPDLRWRWKDEDHLARSVELGWMSQADADALRREGETVIASLKNPAPPFSEPWPSWRADPAWPLPELPDDWATVPAYA